MGKIAKIYPGSLANELDLSINDEVLSINGQKIHDILDYHVLMSDEYVEIEVKKTNGEQIIYEVDKEEDELLGVAWQHPTIDKIKLCHNKCIFCFVDQIPKNMRKTLQFRDDDYRLSFLHGNYITLTNVNETDLKRIVALRLSPINISVHTTNSQLRKDMLGNKKAAEILEQIKYLADHDIEMHTQVVLCPSINDDKELENTISDLRGFFPKVKTLSIVPVGLTDFRNQLHDIKPLTEYDAIKTIEIIESWQNRNLEEFNNAFVYGADELYVLANKEVPEAKYYDGFEQTENGVGLIRLFLDELNCNAEGLSKIDSTKKFLILTGSSAQSTIETTINIITEKTSLDINYLVIPNRFYGDKVTVTGLITGYDIIEELQNNKKIKYMDYDEIIIPDIMLKEDDNIFLDNIHVSEVEKQIGKKLTIVATNASGLIESVTQQPLTNRFQKQANKEYQLRSQRYERCDFFA
ncbi:DUF512 domain-containing protein [Desulfuribacillus alkaliarsenatis]|uniref:Uncharacterized protein n=1 Tax=Desulfuribacillus alkaliarsenatis TaxID=766136 RepID=A0A1E5FZN6_9FIRM|nr:DUF512 domain-containing protein [Desulfuribacillus alkaliarsenatis]OEF96024.1 hypothetical protein BHF68_09765 [Desulfuribacillus alkaliarsenatis]